MSNQPPLGVVVSHVIAGTPHWVWAVLALVTAIGLRQLMPRRVPRAQLLIMPVALAAYSLWSAANALGAGAALPWLAGVALAFAITALLPRLAVETDAAGRLVLAGSPWPLLLIWSIFVLRYALAVTQVMDPALAHRGDVTLAVALAYGTLSGCFAARAWRVLRAAPPAAAVQPAVAA